MKRLLLFLSIAACLTGGVVFAGDFRAEGFNFAAPTVNGKSNVYSPTAGEIVYDSSDSNFYGRDHNSNWINLTAGASLVPPGSILPYAGTTAPSGFMFCDGTAISRTTYAALYAAIGSSYGSGDGSTTFNLPDLRGRFMRGVDNGTGRDPDASSRTAISTGGNTGDNVGSLQADQVVSHSHSSSGSTSAITRPVGGGVQESAVAGSATGTYGGNETRPKNVNVNFIIKL